MSRPDETAAKRPRTGDSARFSFTPDLKVQVEDKVFDVHSLVLGMASPVFKSTLTNGMAESQSGTITLHGKKKDEFQTFLDAITPDSRLTVDDDNVDVLSRWSDEYQVDGLKARCDKFLAENVGVSVAALEFAITYHLERRKTECVQAIRKDFAKYRPEVERLGPTLQADVWEVLWPEVCKAAGLEEMAMPPLEQVRALWPFVKNGMAMTARIRSAAVEKWPDELFNAVLWRQGQAQSKARDWLKSKVKDLELMK